MSDGAGDDVLAAAGAGRPQAQSVDTLAVEIIEDPAKREGARTWEGTSPAQTATDPDQRPGWGTWVTRVLGA